MPKIHKQAEDKRDGVINPQNYKCSGQKKERGERLDE